MIDETSGEEIPWAEGDVFTIEMPSENPDVVPTCNACSQVTDMESCNSYNVTQGQCQWVSRNDIPERRHPTKLYPIFGDWIFYNWDFLIFILVTIIALAKIPTKSINNTIPYMGTILKNNHTIRGYSSGL